MAWKRWAVGGPAALLAAATVSPFASYAALATGRGAAAALLLATAQALAVGVVLRAALPPGGLRGLALLAPAALLGALGAGAWRSPLDGLRAASGLSHAVLFAGLLVLFGASLRFGRTPLVTTIARRLNPAFHGGMEGYTRAVTVAWCVFFAGQLAASAVLLLLAPRAWRPFVTVLGWPLVVAMAAAEYAVRRWRFRNETHTTLLAMIRGACGQAPPRPGHRRARALPC